MLVLDGNIPRFPWEPSTTMLTYRLQGTTEATASNRNRHPVCTPDAQHAQEPRGRGDHIFARPGEHPEVLCDADLGFRASGQAVVLLRSFAAPVPRRSMASRTRSSSPGHRCP